MRKIETTACVFMAVFAAIACAGIAVGHDWKLALVPFTMVPGLKIISIELNPGIKPPSFLSSPLISVISFSIILMFNLPIFSFKSCRIFS